MERIIDASFWASLRREEGFAPTISIAYLPPEHPAESIVLDGRIPLQAEALTRFAPAVERPGIHLGVWPDNGGTLSVWGATDTLPAGCFVLEVVAPGLLVIKQPGTDELAKYANLAVLEGDQVKILSYTSSAAGVTPAILGKLLGLDEAPSDLLRLAVSMRKHGRGGSLLIVPAADGAWQESIVHPIHYRVQPSSNAVETLAGLTAVDGATIITTSCELLAFGAKISRRANEPRIEQVAALELIDNAEIQIIHPSQLGGMRHLSAAQFAQDQRDSVALVASQDGRFTVFVWSEKDQMVQAYRVESFLV